MILYLIIFFIIIFILIKINLPKFNKEDFLVKKRLPIAVTWTPYVSDFLYQPAYSNYFYDNGYMYPIY